MCFLCEYYICFCLAFDMLYYFKFRTNSTKTCSVRRMKPCGDDVPASQSAVLRIATRFFVLLYYDSLISNGFLWPISHPTNYINSVMDLYNANVLVMTSKLNKNVFFSLFKYELRLAFRCSPVKLSLHFPTHVYATT